MEETKQETRLEKADKFLKTILPKKTKEEEDLETAKMNWSELWLEEEEAGLLKLLPIANLVLEFIILIMLFFKK